MDAITTFSSDKESLYEVLKAISVGRYQLPEFQRGWVWDDAHIVSLLASVSLSYPIGAVMMLENGNPAVRFKPRLVEGVELNCDREPERFILDGQQRLTSLYQSLFRRKPVKTRDGKNHFIYRWYYVDMAKALDPSLDREEAIRSLPEDRRIRSSRGEILEDYSTPAAEFAHGLFPLSCVFDCAEWRCSFNAHWGHAPDKTKLFDQFERNVIKRFEQYQLPVIKLLKETPKVAVCQVFEKVNTGGVSLKVFELVTASFAADGFNLREDWEGRHDPYGRKVVGGRKDKIHEQKVLQAVGADELLQVISLLTTFDRKQRDPNAPVSCKRSDILELSLNDFKKWADKAVAGFLSAGKILYQQKLFASRDLPYTTQLVPLAAILAVLGDKALNDSIRGKLIRWYWCGVFGELYGGAIESRFARDLVEVLKWIREGGPEPSTVAECNFAPNRLRSLRTRNSAAYKGLHALLMRDGCLDFRTGEPIEMQSYFDEAIDIHHIFPRDWCQKNGIDLVERDSIINKTPLSSRTNRIIGGNAPSVYLRKLRDDHGISEDRQRQILESHAIEPSAILADDFRAFYDARREALLTRIERATGKAIPRDLAVTSDEQEEISDEPEEVAQP
ncbi:MAG: DUF262 domain-containing protein [Thermogutta sp.]|nr:DUF262 domain-containing protein [Thermogutta sp.]